MMRQLNDKQREIVMFHRSWCKSALIALRNDMPIKPYRVFMSGPGGVGKSHVIRLIHSDTIKLLRLSCCFEPGEVTVLLTAPTGVAAFNIGGMTLHSAFLLNLGRFGYQPLNSEKLNTLRMKFSHLTLLVIDEVSMVVLLEIHKRLQQINGVSADHMFGGISILAVGDLYQLPPVYCLNVDVDKRNSEMLNNLTPEDQQVVIKSLDTISGQTAHINLSKLSEKSSDTGGLHGTLKLAVGSRVMLTANVDVSDGLVNGARSTVVEFVRNGGAIVKILVFFDNHNVGTSAMQSNQSTAQYNNAVPLKKHEVTFLAKNKRGSEITRVQLPLTLAWATTIHKVQGLTLDKIVFSHVCRIDDRKSG